MQAALPQISKGLPKFSNKESSFVFFLGDEGMVLTYFKEGSIEKKFFFNQLTQEIADTITVMVKGEPKAKIYLLLDVIDQTYQIQSLPPVAKFSVQKLVKTRLERDFAPNDITSSLPLGKEESGRQDWKFLFISVVPSTLLMQWLDLILELDNPFKGIFLVPVESQQLLEYLTASREDPCRWKLLVLHNKVSGFRQVITKDDKLIFTRITQSSTSGQSALVTAGNIEQEVHSTIEYLKRISFKEEEGLDVNIVAAKEVIDALDPAKIPSNRYHDFLSPADIAQNFGMDEGPFEDNHFADILFSAYIHHGKKRILPLKTQLAKKLALFQLGLTALKIFTILLCLILLGLAGKNIYAWYGAYTEATPLKAVVRKHNIEISDLERDSDLLPDDAEKIQDIVSIHEKFSVQSDAPIGFIEKLASAIERGIIIRDISWTSKADYTTLAKKETEVVNVEIKVEFNRPFSRAEEKLNFILEFMEKLAISFPNKTISYSNIQGTIKEGSRIIVDYTNPESAKLARTPIETTINLKTVEDEQGAK
jgi:hypothetical protein